MALLKDHSLFPAFPQFFDDFLMKDLWNWGSRMNNGYSTTLPSVNVIEGHDGFTVEMAAPGMHKKDFQVELNNETLTITSRKEMTEELNEGESYLRREFSYQTFERSFHLPKSVVDESKIKATYQNGILRVLIPKKEEAKALPPRRIAIA